MHVGEDLCYYENVYHLAIIIMCSCINFITRISHVLGNRQPAESYNDFPLPQETVPVVPEDQPTDGKVTIPRRSTRISRPPERYGFKT